MDEMSKVSKQEFIKFVDKMPAFPKSVQNIVQLTSDVNASAKEIVRVIESDPIMTVKILKVVNSAYYGLPQKITSVRRAVVQIGLNTIKNLALSVAAMGVLNPINKADFNAQNFLLHSLTTAEISKKLAERIGIAKTQSSDFFVAGLLHDFGKILFAEFVPVDFKFALEKTAEFNVSLHRVETKVIGLSHAKVGQLLAEKWELDAALIDVIHNHHDNKGQGVMHNCVFAANQISKYLEFGDAGNPVIEPLPEHMIVALQGDINQLIDDLGDLSLIKTEAATLINL